MSSGSRDVWLLRAPRASGVFKESGFQAVWTSGNDYDTNQLGAHVVHFVAFGSGSAGEWWLRAPAFRDSGQDRFVELFFDVATTGKYSSSYRASVALKVAFGFCIRRFLNL